MKKILPVLVVLLALGAAGATVFFFQRTATASTSVVAGYLPADSLLLLSVPDPKQAAADWRDSDLYKLWTEPSVQAFFAKPLAKLPVNHDYDDLLPQIERVGPHNIFAALTSLDEKDSTPHVLAGFQFLGSNADVEKLLARPKDALRKASPAGKADLVKYQDHALETFTIETGKTVVSTYLNDWYFVSNDLALLKATLDLADHRAPAGHVTLATLATLATDADFQTVLAKLPAHPATLIYAKPRIFFDRIFALAATASQPLNEEQIAEVRKIKAIAATTAFDHGKLRDTIYSLAPGQKQSAPLQMSALPLSSVDTLLFYATVLQLPSHYELPASPGAAAGPGAAGYALLGQWLDQYKAQGLTLESFNAAFGRELSLQLDWPAGSSQPALLLSLDVRDPAASAQLLDRFIKSPGLNWQEVNADGLIFHSLSLPMLSLVAPTLALTSKHLVLGLSATDVRAAVAREKAGGANFTSNEAYKTAAATVGKPNVATTYIDAKTLFERAYATLKPLAMFGAAFAGPQVNDYVDLSKLPDGDAISKHLSPIVLSEKSDDQGTMLESVGPVTFIQASAGLGVVVGAAAAPMLQKQIAAAMGHPEEPESAPAATPQPVDGQ